MKYKNKRYNKKYRSTGSSNLSELIFIQLTACGIVMLGLLVLFILSPASLEIRAGIEGVLNNTDFFVADINLNAQHHIPEDFSIDESLLDEVEWRNP